MAFSNTAFKPMSPQQAQGAPNAFLYSTADTIATVNTAGYFNDISDILTVNDIIFAVTSTGGTPVVSIVYVNSNSGGVVDVTDGLTVTATDTD